MLQPKFRRRGRRPYPELRRPVRRRCASRESPTSLCRRGFRLARCGKVCANWFGPPAVLRIAVGGRAELRPGCSDSCCRSLRSISLILSLEYQDAEFDGRKFVRFVLCRGSQELFPYFPTKLKVMGAAALEYSYRGLMPPGIAVVLNESRIGFTRSRTLASRQQSASFTILDSSPESGRPARNKRSDRTMACKISIDSSK